MATCVHFQPVHLICICALPMGVVTPSLASRGEFVLLLRPI